MVQLYHSRYPFSEISSRGLIIIKIESAGGYVLCDLGRTPKACERVERIFHVLGKKPKIPGQLYADKPVGLSSLSDLADKLKGLYDIIYVDLHEVIESL